jgi:hypothetical protein
MTHLELASALRSRIADGLSGNIADQSFSLDQLLEEIDLVRADFVHKYSMTSKLDLKHLIQSTGNLEIVCRPLQETCGFSCGVDEIPSVKVPKLMAALGDESIQYVGLSNMQEAFAVYMHPEDIRNHKVRIRTRQRPYAFWDTVTDDENMQTIYLFITVRSVFEHPTHILQGNPLNKDVDYPAPLHMQNAILDNLTEKYIRYHRQLNVVVPPNTQSDNI